MIRKLMNDIKQSNPKPLINGKKKRVLMQKQIKKNIQQQVDEGRRRSSSGRALRNKPVSSYRLGTRKDYFDMALSRFKPEDSLKAQPFP